MNNNKLVAKQKQYQELSTNIKTPKTKLHVLKEDLCKALGKNEVIKMGLNMNNVINANMNNVNTNL